MTRFALLSLAASVALLAQQPFVPLDGVVNSANYLPGCAPNGGIAQGSFFAVFGRDLGPTALATANAFPLQTTLDGAAIRVAMSGAAFDAWPLYANSTQLGAILPSAVPTLAMAC